MGVQATKLIPGNTNDQNALALQYQLINNVSKHFFLRRLVSKKRRRLLVGGYDLDMSYITNQQDYDSSHFNGLVEKFPFDDNHVPPLPMIMEFCQNVHSWLSSDPKNIAVIHCMAGKGRTGLMVSSFLVYTGMLAEEALQVYADKRTTNNLGVSSLLI
ncbi:Dual specificity phosphatase, catalytic domain-containing protein, partial [Cynara cardunculus var. scolymus]